MDIYEKDIQDFFLEKLIEVGMAPSGGDLEIISSIVFDYLVHIEILDPDDVELDDREFDY